MNHADLVYSESAARRASNEIAMPPNGTAAARAIWFDSRALDAAEPGMLARLANTRYTGAVWYPDNIHAAETALRSRLDAVLQVENASELSVLDSCASADRIVISSHDETALARARDLGYRSCFRSFITDAEGLATAIQVGKAHDYLLLHFNDPTNIPLELVIASLQQTQTVLIKQIAVDDAVDDAVVALGVMEVGADGVLFSPRTHAALDAFLARLEATSAGVVPISVARITRTLPIGMGHRSCLDLATLFEPNEGMLIGSTSQGGILCCPEVFFLPYMELRPFRVNAGAVHSYVFNADDRTNYITELRTGSSVLVVDAQGRSRRAAIGRVKTEVRPLRLIEAEHASGEIINVVMQDDWHVRVFSDDAKPLNITELRRGDAVLAHYSKPGRHVGIRVDEQIVEH